MSRLRLMSGIVLVAMLAAPLLVLGAPLPGTPTVRAVTGAASTGVLIIENVGQWPTDAHFQVWGGPGTLWLAQDALWLTVVDRSDNAAPAGPRAKHFESGYTGMPAQPGTGVNLKLSFVGANPAAGS